MVEALEAIHILLVEDNPNDVEITKRALHKGQIKNELMVARDGQEALDLLQGPDNALPGLILLDLNLPKVDGIDVLRKIKSDENLKRIPVIVLTTSTREEDVIRTYDLGVNTFISKPVRFEEFVKVVSSIQEYWLLIATLPTKVHA